MVALEFLSVVSGGVLGEIQVSKWVKRFKFLSGLLVLRVVQCVGPKLLVARWEISRGGVRTLLLRPNLGGSSLSQIPFSVQMCQWFAVSLHD